MAQDGEGNHFLLTYLNETLPKFGLDAETYAPYVMGCFENIDYDNETSSGDDSDETLEESLTEIIGLLQASSESHSDDESVWEELKAEVMKKHMDFVKESNEKKNAELMEKRKMEEITRQKEIEEAQRELEALEAKKLQEDNKEMSEAKRALLEQYAYDTSEQYDNDGNLIDPNKKSGESGGDGDLSNKAVAQKVHQEKMQSQRQQGTTTKNEERIKTKNAKMDKMKQKEERRKRATKGERRR